jgi:hypothetical protein
MTAEHRRLQEELERRRNWKRWGPYLSERQWGTVREDYSRDGRFWDSFPHDHARSRAYRWGEDGILGFCDRECRLCFSLAMWNGSDPILKERFFGLTNPEGNHGEDVKEHYQYLDATPTYSYCRGRYRYPQLPYPYERLLAESRRRSHRDPEYELVDTGIFDDGRYWDVTAEYAKAGPDDMLIRLGVRNRGPDPATLYLLPTLWFRNTWTWGCSHEGCTLRPIIRLDHDMILAEHETLGRFTLAYGAEPSGRPPRILFTDNETNRQRLFGVPNTAPYVKDAFHEYLIHGNHDAVNPKQIGTKAGLLYRVSLAAGKRIEIKLRLTAEGERSGQPLRRMFTSIMQDRRAEASAYYAALLPPSLPTGERQVVTAAWAGLLWSKQFYHYVVEDWLQGDPDEPSPASERRRGRNADWGHLFNRDVISVPDKWEFPWYASWDLGFHMVPMAQIDPDFAKAQCLLFLREWYMHPNGQMPAYEGNLSDTNPPVHAWACRRVFEIDAQQRGRPDHAFLARCFQKLLLNFTWWVNRKDRDGRNIFSGGFLGLDNIGVLDRSQLPAGTTLEQADATAWMGFYCANMLGIALELALVDPVYEDLASKFFEHFIAVCDAINTLGGIGLWDEEAGLYRDQLHVGNRILPLPIRSMVGLLPLIAVEVIEQSTIDQLPGFKRRMQWFLDHRSDLARHVSYMQFAVAGQGDHAHRLLALPSGERLRRVLSLMFDEAEFLSPFGIRSLSMRHHSHPFIMESNGQKCRVDYAPGESDSGLFGGNSNWRGPVWLPVNYLIVEALRKYHHFYGNSFTVSCPGPSGPERSLGEAADEIARRCVGLFLPDASGVRPCAQSLGSLAAHPDWRDEIHFHEYFHADTGKGLGASHQTGWTALAASLALELHRGQTTRSRRTM